MNMRSSGLTGFCFHATERGLSRHFTEGLRTASSGNTNVLLMGQLYTWDDPTASIDDTLQALAERIEAGGLKAALQLFDGEWALIVEDTRAKTVSFITDQRGTHPVYVLDSAGDLFIGSSMSAICRYAPAKLDEDRVAVFLSRGDKDSGQPLYFGSQRLAPRQMLTVDAAGQVTQQSWLTWDSEEPYDPDLDVIESLFADAITNEANVLDKPIAGTLSGGSDSTAVCVFLSHIPDFKCYSINAGPGVDNEEDKINATLSAVEMRHEYIEGRFDVSDLRTLTLLSGEPIRGLKTISTLYTCASHASRDGMKSLAVGWGPDTYTLWGTRMQLLQYVHFLLSKMYLRTLFTSLPRLARFHGGTIPSMILDYGRAGLSALIHRGNIVRKGKPEKVRHLKKEYLRAHPIERPINLKKWTIQLLDGTFLFPSARAIEASCGVKLAAPFFSRHLIRHLLRCRSEKMMIGGHTKPIMRKALEGVLPAHVAWPAVKKPIPSRTMEDIIFDETAKAIVEPALAASQLLPKMLISDPVAAFRSDREQKINAEFWLRCAQVAFLEYPSWSRKVW